LYYQLIAWRKKVMFALYFGSFAATLNTLFLLAIVAFVVLATRKRAEIAKWGRLTALILLVGTAVSVLSATRDGYGAPGALFPMDGAQSLVCSIAGGLVYLTGIVCLFVRRQGFRRAGFYAAAGLMALMVLTVEGSRIFYLTGGRL
jgi:hypothetical protein